MHKKHYLLVALAVFFGNSTEVYANMDMTKNFEGFRSKSYRDSLGIKTIGYGFNMQACGIKGNTITKSRADSIFIREYAKAQAIAAQYVGRDRFNQLTKMQQSILTDMAYNMGYGLLKFKRLRSNILSNNVKGVRNELAKSRWAKQVSNRAKHHIKNWSV